VNVLADYRRYLMPLPFYTIAMRALHVARYGSGSEDPRVPPFYLGYPTLVRGYDLSSQIVAECVVVLSSGCDEVAHMLGSRMAVGNVEFRFPVLRPRGVSSDMYGPVPTEIAVFLDAGRIWRRAGFDAGGSHPAWSTGVTVRTSLMGFGLGQFDIARPFRTPGAGWVFQFNLAPPL
jgi:outer membrane protein assembly factor BamA